jgi:hypothetical protein
VLTEKGATQFQNYVEGSRALYSQTQSDQLAKEQRSRDFQIYRMGVADAIRDANKVSDEAAKDSKKPGTTVGGVFMTDAARASLISVGIPEAAIDYPNVRGRLGPVLDTKGDLSGSADAIEDAVEEALKIWEETVPAGQLGRLTRDIQATTNKLFGTPTQGVTPVQPITQPGGGALDFMKGRGK